MTKRMVFALAVLALPLLVVGCSKPPEVEMQKANATIQAARAAEADMYAPQSLAAAQDTLNLGWKLSAVLGGLADPSLLKTYSDERQPVAQRLIDFDREWSAMMAAGPKDPEHPERGGVDPDELQAYFMQAGRYTAGLGVQYTASRLTGDAAHQVNPLTGGGIVNALIAGRLAGKIAGQAVQENDCSAERLREYEKTWQQTEGARLARAFRLKQAMFSLNDDRLNRLADTVLKLPFEKRTIINIFKHALLKQPSLIWDAVKVFT